MVIVSSVIVAVHFTYIGMNHFQAAFALKNISGLEAKIHLFERKRSFLIMNINVADW